MDILQAAAQLRPGTSWNYDGKTLKQAEDGTPRVKAPTDDEIKAVLASFVAPPTIQEQLDALWAGGDVAKAMGEKIAAIKAKNTKPA